ncbi:MAG: hypothetical protein ABSB22_14915 [Thermodesulfobacteriota bacterium]
MRRSKLSTMGAVNADILLGLEIASSKRQIVLVPNASPRSKRLGQTNGLSGGEGPSSLPGGEKETKLAK